MWHKCGRCARVLAHHDVCAHARATSQAHGGVRRNPPEHWLMRKWPGPGTCRKTAGGLPLEAKSDLVARPVWPPKAVWVWAGPVYSGRAAGAAGADRRPRGPDLRPATLPPGAPLLAEAPRGGHCRRVPLGVLTGLGAGRRLPGGLAVFGRAAGPGRKRWVSGGSWEPLVLVDPCV